MKSEASWRRRVRPRRISSSADMSGQATTKSGGVPLRAMMCGCEGQPLTALSHERTGTGQSTGQAPMGRRRQDFWGTCSAIHRGIARPVPSSATLTDHERSKRKSMFTKQDTDDRPTPRCCLPTGSPLPELRPRGLVEPGQPTWKHSACLCCWCLADARRCAFVLATEGGLFFNIHKHHKKNSVRSVFC